MNLFSMMAISVMVIQFGLGFSAFRHDPRAPLNRSFLLICLSVCIWALGYAFIYAGADEHSMLWYRIAALGWCVVPSTILVFMLHIADAMPKHRIPLLVLIHIPGVIVLAEALFGTLLVYDFANGPWGGYELQDPFNPVYILYLFYNVGYIITGVIIVRRKAHASKNRVRISQANIITSGFVFAIAFAVVANVVVPQIEPRFPAIGVLGTVVTGLMMWYVIDHYKLMTLTPDIAIREILGSLSDLVFLLDTRGRIIETNTQAARLLGRREDQLVTGDFASLIRESDILKTTLESARSHGGLGFTLRCTMQGSDFSELPVALTWSNIRDRFDEPAGSVVVAHDLRNVIRLEQEIANRRELMRQLEDERNQLHIRNQIIETELALARSIQLRLIPEKPPIPGIATWYRPMDKVGGDFFDFVDFDDGRTTGIFLSDVSGHGVPAAFITSMIKSAVLQMAPRLRDTAALLHYLNDFLISQTNGNFVTAFYGIYDRIDHTFRYTNAGHNEPFVIVPGKREADLLTGSFKSLPLAVLENAELKIRRRGYCECETCLSPGSKLLLYTDGLVESTAAGNLLSAFGETRIHDVIERHGQEPGSSFILRMTDSLISFHGGEDFDDDICLICLDVP